MCVSGSPVLLWNMIPTMYLEYIDNWLDVSVQIDPLSLFHVIESEFKTFYFSCVCEPSFECNVGKTNKSIRKLQKNGKITELSSCWTPEEMFLYCQRDVALLLANIRQSSELKHLQHNKVPVEWRQARKLGWHPLENPNNNFHLTCDEKGFEMWSKFNSVP